MGSNIIGILLAAGKSARMGVAKQLLDIHGEPLIVHTAKKLLAIEDEFKLIIVLGARAEQIQLTLTEVTADIVINENHEKGMGTSLVSALQYIDNQDLNPSAILLSVCDQPYLTTDLLQLFLEKHREFPTKIITARYGENYGVPAILPHRFFSDLKNLQADTGAKKIMSKNQSELIFVDFFQGDFDLDTPVDYQNFLHNLDLGTSI